MGGVPSSGARETTKGEGRAIIGVSLCVRNARGLAGAPSGGGGGGGDGGDEGGRKQEADSGVGTVAELPVL